MSKPDAELVTIARLMLAVNARTAAKAELDQAWDRLTDIEDCMAVTLAFELLSGKGGLVYHGDPEDGRSRAVDGRHGRRHS
jgi:hypothetical protein